MVAPGLVAPNNYPASLVHCSFKPDDGAEGAGSGGERAQELSYDAFRDLVKNTLNNMLAGRAERPQTAFLLPLVKLVFSFEHQGLSGLAGRRLEGQEKLSDAQKSVIEEFLKTKPLIEIDRERGGFLARLKEIVFKSDIFGHLFRQIVNGSTVSAFREGYYAQSEDPDATLPTPFPRAGRLGLGGFLPPHLNAAAPQLCCRQVVDEVAGMTPTFDKRHHWALPERRDRFYGAGYCKSLVTALEAGGASPQDALVTLVVGRLFLDAARQLLLRNVNGYCKTLWTAFFRGTAMAEPLTVSSEAARGWLKLLGRIRAAEVGNKKQEQIGIFGLEGRWEGPGGLARDKLQQLKQLYVPALLFPSNRFCGFKDSNTEAMQLAIIGNMRRQATELIISGDVSGLADQVVAINLAFTRLAVPAPGLFDIRRRALEHPHRKQEPNFLDFCWYVGAGYALGLVQEDQLRRIQRRGVEDFGDLSEQLAALQERTPQMAADLRGGGHEYLAAALERIVGNLKDPTSILRGKQPSAKRQAPLSHDTVLKRSRRLVGKVFVDLGNQRRYFVSDLLPDNDPVQLQVMVWDVKVARGNTHAIRQGRILNASRFLQEVDQRRRAEVVAPEGFQEIKLREHLEQFEPNVLARRAAGEILSPVVGQRLWDGKHYFAIEAIVTERGALAPSKVEIQRYQDATSQAPAGRAKAVAIVEAALLCQFKVWFQVAQSDRDSAAQGNAVQA